MKRLMNLTTCLSLALYVVPPFAAQAQDLKTITVDGKLVTCLPNKQTECPEGAFCVVAKNPAKCEANATEAIASAAAKAAAETTTDTTAGATADTTVAPDATAGTTDAMTQADADAKIAADKAAADQAAADQAAADKAAADKAAADQAAADQAAADQAAADKAAADKAAADKAAADQAAADQAAADKAATDQAATDQAAADQAAADKAAADQAAADQAAADKAAADKATADQAATDQAATDQAAADKAAADKAAADQAAATDTTATATTDTTASTDAAAATDFTTVKVGDKDVICLPSKAAVCPDGALCVVAKPGKCQAKADKMIAAQAGADTTTQGTADGSAQAPDPAVVAAAVAEDAAALAAAKAAADKAAAVAAADPNIKPIDAPKPTEDAVKTLETVLDAPVVTDNAVIETAVVAAAGDVIVGKNAPKAPKAGDPAPAGATVTTETVTKDDTRVSTQEFAAAPVTVAHGKKSGLSDLEKVGLVALGAVVIGAIINGNKQVVANTGDRVVVRQPDGTYVVYKDDNALLREPGSTVRTENYEDGSTRTIVQRQDGSQIVTIRDASGRVLQRVSYDRNGRPTVLIDDLQPEQPVIVSQLPRYQPSRNQISLDQSDADLEAQLAAADAADAGHRYSLRQIRTITEVRYLAPTIDVNNITFETGSSAIQATEAKKLSRLGSFIAKRIEANPGEVFLIEGHTDAVGSAASNLALSDRRAESVAKALTEYYDVPPENLVVQGYGESELKVDSAGDERMNRRVAVRIITSILRQSAI